MKSAGISGAFFSAGCIFFLILTWLRSLKEVSLPAFHTGVLSVLFRFYDSGDYRHALIPEIHRQLTVTFLCCLYVNVMNSALNKDNILQIAMLLKQTLFPAGSKLLIIVSGWAPVNQIPDSI